MIELASDELERAPELASLSVLSAALDVARLSLRVENAELQLDDPRHQSLALGLAEQLVERAGELGVLIARYRAALAAEHDARFDDLPF